MLTKHNKVIIYAQEYFNLDYAKTGIGFIRYATSEVVGIVDKKYSGQYASSIYPSLPKIPIYDSIESAKNARKDADVLLIGVAPPGGKLPLEWIPDIKHALKLNLNIVNGLHDFLNDVKQLSDLAKRNKLWIWDVRKYQGPLLVANAQLLKSPIQVILTVGTDAAIGKMTVAVEMEKAAQQQNLKAKFIATGQTGMMISGGGIPIDAIIGDFMAGAIEEEVLKAARVNYKIAIVEGQGSVFHPAWSGVTLALCHGALPHKLILCHKPDKKTLRNTDIKIESLNQFIKAYENISLPLRKAKVAGIALNTINLNENQTIDIIKQIENETDLPVDDPVKNGGFKLLSSCLN